MLKRVPKILLLPAGFAVGEIIRFVFQQVLSAALPPEQTMNAVDRIFRFIGEAFLLVPPGFLFGVAVGMLAILIWEWRKRRPAVDEESFNPDALYVGDMNFGVGDLEADMFIEISARFFNGTKAELHVHGVRGTIKTDKTQENPDPEIVLPTPTMDDRFIKTTPPLKERLVVIEQRIPRKLAQKIMGLTQGQSVSLNFQSLNILVGPDGDIAKAVRLPVWGGVNISRDPAQLRFGRIVRVEVAARTRPAIQIG